MKKRTPRPADYKPGRAALIWADIQAQRRRRTQRTNTTRRQEDQP